MADGSDAPFTITLHTYTHVDTYTLFISAVTVSSSMFMHACMHACTRMGKKLYVHFHHRASFSAVQRASMTRDAEEWLT
jgi:hypothetical protein